MTFTVAAHDFCTLRPGPALHEHTKYALQVPQAAASVPQAKFHIHAWNVTQSNGGRHWLRIYLRALMTVSQFLELSTLAANTMAGTVIYKLVRVTDLPAECLPGTN